MKTQTNLMLVEEFSEMELEAISGGLVNVVAVDVVDVSIDRTLNNNEVLNNNQVQAAVVVLGGVRQRLTGR